MLLVVVVVVGGGGGGGRVAICADLGGGEWNDVFVDYNSLQNEATDRLYHENHVFATKITLKAVNLRALSGPGIFIPTVLSIKLRPTFHYSTVIPIVSVFWVMQHVGRQHGIYWVILDDIREDVRFGFWS